MKKIKFLIVIVIVGMLMAGCVSTVKFTPELTGKTAATLELESEWNRDRYFGYAENDYTVLEIVYFNNTRVDWDKNLKILIPEGTHNIEIRMRYTDWNNYNTWSGTANISITVHNGEKYFIQCVPVNRNGNVQVQFLDSDRKILSRHPFTLSRLR